MKNSGQKLDKLIAQEAKSPRIDVVDMSPEERKSKVRVLIIKHLANLSQEDLAALYTDVELERMKGN